MRLLRSFAVFATLLLVLPSNLWAAPLLIDFESLSDLSAVTTQFPGVAFSNATVLVAGSTLNELETPPHSGSNVVFDDGGPISIDFTTPFLSFGGFFTYSTPITLTAFDASNNILGSTTSAFGSNFALSGDPGSNPNEFLHLSFAAGVTTLVIGGEPSGGSFVLDDAILETETIVPPVPEPIVLSLLASALGASMCRKRQSRGAGPRVDQAQ